MKISIKGYNDALLLGGQMNERHVICFRKANFARVNCINPAGAK